MSSVTILAKNTLKTTFIVHTISAFGKTEKKPSLYLKMQPLLYVNLFGLLYGTVAILRLYGIGFGSEIVADNLLLRIGFSKPTNIQIPKKLLICIKNDERKKPNIIWVFSHDITSITSFTKLVQKNRILSVFVRKRITGILQINELSTFKFKKWKDKRKKRK